MSDLTLFDLGGDLGRHDRAPGSVLACTDWATNALLIVDLVRLGYLTADQSVVDATYGMGAWWSLWRPRWFRGHDIDPAKAPDGVADFRALPYPDRSIDVVAFDPPYITGAGDTSTAGSFTEKYGIADATSFAELHALIFDGLAETARVVRSGGLLLVKAMSYTNGRTFRPMPALLMARAEQHGLDLVDEFVMRRNPGPTPGDPALIRRARRNCSTLLVFQKRHRPPRSGPGSFAHATNLAADIAPLEVPE